MMEYRFDLLQDATEYLIAHGCNAQGVMGSGVAKVVKVVWPEAYAEYKEHYDTEGLNTGMVIYAESGDKLIANCITQEYYGRNVEQYVDYDAMAVCFEELNETCIYYDIDRIAMPKIGAGLGGGDWDEIVKIIKASFDNKITVVIYDPEF